MSDISVNIKDQKIKQEGLLASIRQSLQEAVADPCCGKPHEDVAAEARRMLKEQLGK